MIRIGQGFDVHQLVPQRPLIIGGVTLPLVWVILGNCFPKPIHSSKMRIL